MKVALVLWLAVVAGSAFGRYEQYSDGSFSEFTEASNYRKVVHSVPVAGTYRVQYSITDVYYTLNGQTFKGEITRSDDTNLDGANDSESTTYYASNGAFLMAKVGSRDGAGVWNHEYSDTQGRRFSSAWWQGRPDYDTRTSVRVYNNAFCYAYNNGSCVIETACDRAIQSMNQLAQFRMVEAARANAAADPLAVKVAEMRYAREQAILNVCPRR